MKKSVKLLLLMQLVTIYTEKNSNLEIVFTNIYQNNAWGSKESVSGGGSTLTQTSLIRKALPELFTSLNIKTILDAPCGDRNWIKEINLTSFTYIGLDIVPEIIQKNKQLFPSINFLLSDICKDSIPQVDLILCRDCLGHLPNNEIINALKNFKKSNSKYLLTTTFTDKNRKVNNDIRAGKWRTIDLSRPPFNIGDPLLIINEECTEGNNKFKDKSLALWEIQAITLPEV
jgi:hypothetical protein